MRAFFTRKRIIWGVIIILVVLFIASRVSAGKKASVAGIQTDTVKKQTIEKTVLTTGQVVSSVDLSLSFQGTGVVRKILVKEGDKVKAGQLLATLDQANVVASLMSANGALAQARANYDRVLAGASNEQINVAQKAVDAAEAALKNAQNNLNSVTSQQTNLVASAHSALMNTGLAAIPGSTNINSNAPVITGVYSGLTEGTYTIVLYQAQSGMRLSYYGLESGDGDIVTQTYIPLGTRGLMMQFPANTPLHGGDTWTVSLPNKSATTYLASYNAYQAALQNQQAALTAAQAQVDSAQVALSQAQANLEVQQASARPADISSAKAQILSAEGQVASAAAAYNNTVVKAPEAGTITKVDIKVGELATSLKEVMVLQNISDLHAEANVSEANVAALQVGQMVDYTFDALGPDRHFKGTISSINPASTVISGVVNYKVTANFENVAEIKPGMTANMTILVARKENALTVPSSAIINKSGKRVVRVIDDTVKKTYHEVDVQTGIDADGGAVEIISGLSEGQSVVTFIKQ